MGLTKILPDYACQTTNNEFKLHKVGNTNISVYRRDSNDERVLTTQSIFVSLTTLENGIHMSRLIEQAINHQGEPITLDDTLLYDIADSHDADNAFWECAWSSMHQLDDRQSIKIDCKVEGIFSNNNTQWFLTLIIPYTSICPCSAKMTQATFGIPHMQRASVSITGTIEEMDEMLIPSVTMDILNALKVYPIPHMKREDELAWCQNASIYNFFVEDAARLSGQVADKWFSDWVVVNTHRESIHQHDVVAICRKGDQLL